MRFPAVVTEYVWFEMEWLTVQRLGEAMFGIRLRSGYPLSGRNQRLGWVESCSHGWCFDRRHERQSSRSRKRIEEEVK